jgi:hypothetical protein
LTAFRQRFWLIGVVALLAVAFVMVYRQRSDDVEAPPAQPERQTASREDHIRQELFRELKPVKLSNCELQRFGEAHDGGYLLCANLLGSVQVGYSYGISGYDGWGCDVSRTLKVKVHQYDCFDLRQPSCPGGGTLFHPECVAGSPKTEDGRLFDTVAGQIAKNKDDGRRLVMKIDVEGAEWDSFSTMPEELLQRIDQLVVEFHHNEDQRFLTVMWRLKQFFHVAHVHFNNYRCENDEKPFPAWAYEVLFVSKRLGRVDPSGSWGGLHPLDAPNQPGAPDCQATFE